MFGEHMHQWATYSATIFTNVIRHMVNTEEEFEIVSNKLIVSNN